VASTQATIDLVVRGSNAVNKLVQDVNQLQSAVDRINSRTLDVGPANLQRRANSLAAVMEGSAARANDLGRDRNQILLQQRQAIERLTQAQLSQQRAIEKAASTEKELVRLGRRDELASRRVSELRDALRESAGQAEQFGDRMAEASASATTLQSRLNQIRQATRNAISAASGLIDVNQTLSAANAVNALAREYNRYGDSLRRSTRESGLTDRTLPRQVAAFGDLRNQIEQAETSLNSLRAQLRQLGSTEVAIDIPVRPVSQRELTSPAGMAQVAQQAAESQRIQQENILRQQRNARRGEVASEIAAQEANLASLETRAGGLGRVIARNQESVSRMMANRNPANQTGLSASLNQIQAQAESLALIANNSAIASTAYNRFTVAAEMASIKLARAQQNTFTALAAGFSGGGGSSIPEGLRRASDVAGARSMVGQVLTEMPTIATGASEAALGSYINMLQNLKTLVPALSIEYRALEEGIARANEEMRSAQLGIVDAPSSRLGSLQAVTQRQRFEDREQKVQEKRQKDINDVFGKQNDLIDKINSSRLSGDQKVDLRERAERAVNALIENRLEDSREMTRLIERQLKAAVDLAKPKPPQFFGVPGKDFLPITGKLTGGDLVPGSPAAKNRIAEEERKAADREFERGSKAFNDLKKYTEKAERNAQKLQASYDRGKLTGALDEYLADLSNIERGTDELLKKLSTVPGTEQSSLKDFDDRLKAAVEGNGASKQLSSQTLQLEKLQKRLVEVEIDGVDVSQNKARVEKLIADIKSGQIPTSKQSVDLVAKELKDARARLGISQSQAKIDGKIADVLRGAVGGPSKKINDLAAQQKYAIEINDTYQKTEEILTSIGKASIPEAQKLALSFGIDQARNELYENRLESAQMITKEISKQLGLETAMQAGTTKKKLTESSWGLAFEKAKDMRQDMGAESLQERNKAQGIMMNQLSALRDIQNRYAIEEKKGVQFLGEKVNLSNLINQIKNNELSLTIANTKAIGEGIRVFNASGRYRKNEAILNDSYGGNSSGNKATETTAQQLEARRERLLNLARGGLSQLITLEGKGVTVSSQKLEIEQAISDIQSLRNKASQQELATLASKVVAARNFASAMAIDLKAGALPGVGLQAALQKLQEARRARQDFFGGASPAEAIDKIAREFNTGKSMAGGRSDLASRAAAAAQQGPEALLGLAELAKPAKASTAELEALSAVLKEFRSVLDPTIQGFDRLDNQLRETAANLDRQIERRAPDADFLTRRFGPRGGRAISEGLIGGAFPLLFGQGLGASLGGLAGGAGGGFLGGGLGFGLSLAGTALGTVFDTLAQAAQDTGKALGYPIEGFESLKTAGLFASRQQEYYISKLIETGETAKATAEIQAEMIKKIGVSGVNDLTNLGDASYKLSKSWAEFNLQLQAALAGPMAGLLQWVTSIVSVSNQSSSSRQLAKDVLGGLSGKAKDRFEIGLIGIDSREQIGTTFGPLLGGISKEEAAKQRTALAEFYRPLAKPTTVKGGKPTPEQELQALDKTIEKTEKARSIIQQGIAFERSGIDLRLSTEETVYGLRKRVIDMEREATEFRRSVEDQVFGKRQELEQKLIENERKRQQNAIDAFDLQLQKASTGLDPIAQGVVDAARDYLRIRAEGEADLQQAEKQLKLELQKIDQEASRYKLQVENRVSQMAIQRDEFSRDVSRARLQIERQIVDYAVQAEDHRLAMAKYRYEVEIDLEKKKQIVVQNGLDDAAIQASAIRQAVQATNGTGASRLPGSISGRLDASGQNGADMPVALNNIMRSYHNGVVTEINKAGNNGNYVVVQFLDDLGNKLEATYSHVAAAVKMGQSVVGGQTIGRFDASGRTFGAHNSIDINSPGTNGALQRNRETAAARRSADMLVRGQVQGVVSGIKPDIDTYLQPGVGYFSRKNGRMVRGLTAGAGQATSVGAAPVFKGTMTMPELPGAPRLVGINDLLQQYLQLVEKTKAATVGATAADRQRLAVQSEAASFALEQQTLAPILQYTEQNRELELEIQKRKERNRLALEGVAPEIIEGELRILEIRRDLNSVLTGLTISTNQAVRSELERLKLNPSLVDSTFALTEATLASLVATTEDTKKQEELRAKLQAILDLRNQLADKVEGRAATVVEEARGVAKKSVMPPSEKIDEKIGKLKEELTELTNVGNIAITVADGIGNAFTQAFQGLISGSMSAQEALASFFKSTGEAFLSMAAEIIAKQMAMIVLQTILKALGAVAGSSGGSAGSAQATPSNWGDFSVTPLSANFAANGAYFANGTAAFAKGGTFTNSIVSSPTLFQFADGGVTKMGEMGEAGPEAIMPLKRGPDGRLGVDASGMEVPYQRSAAAATTPEMEVPYQRSAAAATTPEMEVPYRRSGPALAVPYLKSAGDTVGDSMNATIDVKFETVRIRSVDYVTREEAEQIGRESAQRGAELAHKRYRNSPSARRAVGLS